MSIQCAECSVDLPMSDDDVAKRREDGRTFYCINGHGNVFRGPSPKDMKIERLQRLVRSYMDAHADEFRRRRMAERRLAAARGQITKLRKRLDSQA